MEEYDIKGTKANTVLLIGSGRLETVSRPVSRWPSYWPGTGGRTRGLHCFGQKKEKAIRP